MRPIRCLPLITIYCYLYLINSIAATEHDFQFNDDEHHDDISTKKSFIYNKKFVNNNNKSTYSLDVSKCPFSENKIMLTLVLKSNDWKDLVASKKNRIINKLSKFFAIPKEFIRLESINRRDIHDMTKRSIKRGPNKCNLNRQLGKIEFMIGCGETFFNIGELLSNQIVEQMKDGSIDDITRIDFGWWVIWHKRISNRVPRSKRENKLDDEGSGEDDFDGDDDEYDEYEYDGDTITDVPATPSTTTAHAHRHHHGDSKTDFIDGDVKNIPIDIPNTLELTNIKFKKNDIKSQAPLQPIDDDIVKQLESVISKTIENTEKIKPLEESTTSSITSVINIDDDDDEDSDDDDDDYLIEEDILSQSKIINSTESSIQINVKSTITDKILNENVIETSSIESITNIISINIPISTSTISNLDNKAISSSLPNNEPYTPTISTASSAPIEEVTTTQNTLSINSNSSNYPTTTASSSVQSVKNIDETTVETTLTDDSVYNSQSTRNIINKLMNENKFQTTTISPIYLVKNFLHDSNTNNNNKYSNPSTINYLNISEVVTEQSPITVSSTAIPKTTTTLLSTSATMLLSTPNILSTISETLASNNMGKENYTDSSKDDETSFETTVAAVNRDDDLSFEGNLTNSIFDVTTTPAPTTTKPTTTTTTRATTTTTEFIETITRNVVPEIRVRMKKQKVTAGKLFNIKIPDETFYDREGDRLKLELLDNNNENLGYYSWIQFRQGSNEMYGLALDETVSNYEFKLKATDSQNDSVVEDIKINVQQYQGTRSANHEIALELKLNKKYSHNLNWQMKILEAISNILSDDSLEIIVVQSVKVDENNSDNIVLKYFNETLPKDPCPEKELNNLIQRLKINSLNEYLRSDISVKSIKGKLINSCEKPAVPPAPPPTTPAIIKNLPPVPRNPVDRINATVGHLLAYKVPYDTFYDPEDTTNLKLYVVTADRDELPPRHWLQFDSKNQEFYGIPKAYGTEQYLLIAEDSGGLRAMDALEVVIGHPIRREYSILFKAYLGIRHEQFTPAMQRKFIEKVAKIFKDSSTQYIQIRSITTHHDTDGTIVNFYNTTLFRSHMRCPEEEIEHVRLTWFSLESNLRDGIKNEMSEFSMKNLQMLPLTSCYYDPPRNDIVPLRPDDASNDSFTNEYLYTFILPAVIILFMIILASIVACVLHRRRKTGKMELGDEEERKSFRSKGIPVIFQDELDEKPEIGNKSPIILKDEKPPLLPPSYNSTNVDGDNDCDEYVPPPAVVIGGREIRGKSPVTPSYRKPPPYVSP